MGLLPGFEDVGYKVLAAAGGQINFHGQLLLDFNQLVTKEQTLKGSSLFASAML